MSPPSSSPPRQQALRDLLQQREAERLARVATSSVAASSVADASARLRAPSPPATITLHGREVAGQGEHSSARWVRGGLKAWRGVPLCVCV